MTSGSEPGSEPRSDREGGTASGEPAIALQDDASPSAAVLQDDAPLPEERAVSLDEVPEPLLAGYLDAALDALRAVDPVDLPSTLRPFRTWTPQRLRSGRVLAAVRRALGADSAFREAVATGILADQEPLANLLRAGRHAEVLASGEPPVEVVRVALALGPSGAPAVRAAVDQAARADAEARVGRAETAAAEAAAGLEAARQRAESETAALRAARAELREAEARRAQVERERRRLAERLGAFRRDLDEARATAAAVERRVSEERRRLTVQLQEQRVTIERLHRENRRLRRPGAPDPALVEAVTALGRDVDVLRRAAGITSGDASTPRLPEPERPRRRSPLPVPGGRTADDPATLLAWVATAGVLVLIDGYNVTKHPAAPDLPLPEQRALLLARCRRLVRRGGEIVVVFDGAATGPLPGRQVVGGVVEVFSDPHRTADDEIVARVTAEPLARPVVVVSSDNEVRDRSGALGASVVHSVVLLGAENR